MADMSTGLGVDQPAAYQIIVQGELGQGWADWFDGGLGVSSVTITVECSVTALTAAVADQPARFGLLIEIRDLGLPLLLVHCVEKASSPEDYGGRPAMTGPTTIGET
jgi:hypothetical protein